MGTEAKPPRSFNFEAENLNKEWTEWLQNFTIFLTACKKKKESDEIKIATILNQLGHRGVEIFNTLRQDAIIQLQEEAEDETERKKAEEKALATYNDVVEAFTKYFAP
uniref:Uncharacterized protein n=1 Tax=Lygus hesperus TaxID=30085 RepID=A0A146KXU1_LYGHE